METGLAHMKQRTIRDSKSRCHKLRGKCGDGGVVSQQPRELRWLGWPPADLRKEQDSGVVTCQGEGTVCVWHGVLVGHCRFSISVEIRYKWMTAMHEIKNGLEC